MTKTELRQRREITSHKGKRLRYRRHGPNALTRRHCAVQSDMREDAVSPIESSEVGHTESKMICAVCHGSLQFQVSRTIVKADACSILVLICI
jgi:hypothetical protein